MSETQLSTTVTCVICNKTMKCITRTHLAQHGHTIETYQAAFPTAAITNDAELHRRATNFRAINNENKGKKRDLEIGRRISETKKSNKHTAWNKGVKKTAEERAAQSVRVKQQYDSGERVGPNLGRKMSEETKQKIREKAKQNVARRGKPVDVNPKHSAEEYRVHKQTESTERHIARATELGFNALTLNSEHITLECIACGTQTTCRRHRLNPAHVINNGLLVCRTCHPKLSGVSHAEREVCDYIKSIIPQTKVISNDRCVLEGKEIDILIPELNLGFEFNGLYWHAETVCNRHLHHALHKTLFAYNKGIRLVTIFEDEWNSKQDIVKSRIAHMLNQNATLCYARECVIEPIDFKSCQEFLDLNHIQGSDKSKVRYGAYFDGNLVGVMTFKPSSFVKGGDGGEWELSRFAVQSFINIPGLASKMLKRFNNDFNNPPLISYADARWSVGNVYKSIGFKYVGRSSPSYWYVRTDSWCEREHRSRHMKHLLLERYPDSDHSKTEWEIMQENGWDRIWDCGTLKYTMNC